MLQQTVQDVWNYNVDRHSPSDIGDTNRSLGIAAFENIRTLVVRQVNSADRPEDLSQAVRASAADNSLLVKAAGIRLRVVKAPPTVLLAEPRWEQFDWSSEVRSVAALDNHDRYVPVGVGDLFEGSLPPLGAVDLLQNVFLVWAGGSDSPLTAGWLGLPTVGETPWLAVEPLWWDEPGDSGWGRNAPVKRGSDGDTFSSRHAPQPAVALKRRSRKSRISD